MGTHLPSAVQHGVLCISYVGMCIHTHDMPHSSACIHMCITALYTRTHTQTTHTYTHSHRAHIRRVCTYTPIHTHTLTHKPHIHTHILAQCTYHIHVHVRTYVHMHVHTHYAYAHACIHTSIHTAHMPPHTNHTDLCVHATHTYTLTHIRTYMYSQTLAHIHSGTRWLQCTGPLPGASLPPWGAHPQTTRPGHRQDPCATSHRLGRSLCSGQSQICRRRNQQVHPGLLCQARPPTHTHKQGSPATPLPADLPATHAACGSQRRAAVAEARVHPEHNRHSLLSAARPRTGASAGEWPPVRGQHSPACSGDPPPLEHQAPAI